MLNSLMKIGEKLFFHTLFLTTNYSKFYYKNKTMTHDKIIPKRNENKREK